MRVVLLCLTLVAGLAAIAIALLMPAHLRATDPHVIEQVGAESRSLVQLASETAAHNPAVAKMLLASAESLSLPGTDKIVDELRTAARDRTRSRTLLEQLEAQEAGRIQVTETPVLNALRKSANRERLVASLQSTEAKQILKNRWLTNLTIFAPVHSAAGVPLDVAILTTAFLMEQRALPPSLPLHDQVLRLTALGDPALEEFYLSIFALAKRFSSEQLIALAANLANVNSLHTLTRFIQEHPDSAALIYATTIASKDGGAVAAYLERYSKTAERDLRFALSAGVGGINRLLNDQQPIYRRAPYDFLTGFSAVRWLLQPFLGLGIKAPTFAIIQKFALLGLGGFLLATATRFRDRNAIDQPYVFIPKLSLVRRAAFVTVFLLLAIILGEPYLAQGETKPPPVRVSFPLLGTGSGSSPLPVTIPKSTPMLDPHTILAIVTFLILQTVIYVVCLVKLTEIQKQPVSNATKIKLLDNEDNLFDGGLYAGLFGTAASLILLTLGVIKPSLVSAYSSTLFGILFVALLKIGHVRPLKRRLLLGLPMEVQPKKIITPAVAASTETAPPTNPFA